MGKPAAFTHSVLATMPDRQRFAVYCVLDGKGQFLAAFPFSQRKRAEEFARKHPDAYVNLTKLAAGQSPLDLKR